MIGIHVKHPLQIIKQNRGLGTNRLAQMFHIKKFASSLNSKFEFHFSFKFLFDPSGGENIQQKNGNEKPQVLPCTDTQSSLIQLVLCDCPHRRSIPHLAKRRQGLPSTGVKFHLLETLTW